jgi:hypothetical protein
MRRQRHVMYRQWKAMREQLSEMGTQTEVLKDSVSHAGTSAESALRSVKLQEAQLRQWVNTDNWKLQAPNIPPNATAITMRLTFDIVNPTSMPLTLKYIWCDGNFIWGPARILSGGVQPTYLLAPNGRFPIQQFFDIAGDNFLRFQKEKVGVAISCKVSFEDVFGNPQAQSFGKVCTFTRHGTVGFEDFKSTAETQESKKAN